MAGGAAAVRGGAAAAGGASTAYSLGSLGQSGAGWRRLRAWRRRPRSGRGCCFASQRAARRAPPKASSPVSRDGGQSRLQRNRRLFHHRHDPATPPATIATSRHAERGPARLGQAHEAPAQSISHGATLAAHAVRSGDSHGGGSSVNLSESDRS